ncbi:MAG: hypothetical protein ACRDD2_13555 [Sarcina sp.]
MSKVVLTLKEQIKEKKSFILIGIILFLMIIGIIFFINFINKPTLKLESTIKEISATSKEEIQVLTVLTKLPDNQYPAASVNIKFDNNKLELVDLATGTMECYNDFNEENGEELKFKIPKWSYNKELANKEGVIKAMYLDTTAGKNAYGKEGFEKDKKDVPFKLIFKLKNSANVGDKILIDLEEAVFATVNGDKDRSTLSSKKGYGDLNIKDLTIKVS